MADDKLFYLSINANPSLSKRIAFGDASSEENMTLKQHIELVIDNIPDSDVTTKGLIEMSTTEEAKTATNDETSMTPLKTKQFLDSQLSDNVMTLSGKNSAVTVTEYNARKLGRFITGYFIAKSSASGDVKVGTLSGWIPVHEGNWHFIGTTNTGNNEAGRGYVTQGSNIFININNDNIDYIFNFVIPVSEEPQ